MTAQLPQLLGKVSFGLAVLLILPGLVSGIGVFAALINVIFAIVSREVVYASRFMGVESPDQLITADSRAD